MLVVHHLENSRSHRILWLLEELSLPYELRHYKRDPKTMLAPASLRAIHPLGKSPILEDNGLVLVESGAIIEYVLDTYGEGRLRPSASPAKDYYRMWMHYAEGSVMSLYVWKLVLRQMVATGPALLRPVLQKVREGLNKEYVDKELSTHIRYCEQILTYNRFFTGDDFTAADIQMSFVLEAFAQSGEPRKVSAPHCLALLERLRMRPAYQRALEKGGPLVLAAR